MNLLLWSAAAALQATAPTAPALPAPAPTPAAPTTEASDGRCLAAFAYLAKGEGETADAGKLGVVFFYGKLIGRDPALDTTALLRSSAVAITPILQAELKRCGGELAAAGALLSAAGQSLQANPAAPQ